MDKYGNVKLDWDAGNGHLCVTDEGGNPVDMTEGEVFDAEFARRVAAAWNWSRGISIEVLEQMAGNTERFQDARKGRL